MHTHTWLDVNECLSNNGGGHAKRACVNSAGSMSCANCASGYANDGPKGCKGLCCEPNLSVYTCQWQTIACVVSFWLLSTRKQSDVDECANDNGGCDAKRECKNKVGSYSCGDCPVGWDNSGSMGCKGLCVVMDRFSNILNLHSIDSNFRAAVI